MEQRLAGDGWEAFAEIHGAGPTLLLVHAPDWLGDRDEWRELVPPLVAAGWRCVLLDLPGFGRARAPREATATTMTAALREACRTYLGADGHLIARGYSAAYAALLAGELDPPPASLVALLPEGMEPVTSTDWTLPWWARITWRLFASPPVVGERLRESVFCTPAAATPERVAAQVRRTRRRAAPAMQIAARSGRLAIDCRRAWCELSQPVLLIWGEASTDPPLDEAERWILPLRPDAPFMMIDQRPVGVWKTSVTYRAIGRTRRLPQVESPAEVATAILRHLGRGA